MPSRVDAEQVASSTGNKRAALRLAVWWSYLGNFYLTAGQFVLGVVLARLLGPAEFGVFIAVTAFTSLSLMAAQFGLPQACLQARVLDIAAVDGAFWTMCSLAVIALSVLVVLAGPLAALYAEADFRPVLLSMAGTLLLAPYTGMGFALLRRDMRFAEVARMNMRAFSISAVVAVVSAALGLGVYALVLAGYSSMLVNTFNIYRALPWRPGRPGVMAVRPLLRYSAFTTANNLLSVSGSRVDNMIIGALLGAGALGLYNRAYSLARIPSDQFGESLGPLLLGSLARIQEDIDASRSKYLAALAAISNVTLPLLVVLVIAGPAAILAIYGPAWSGAGVPLQVMAIGAMPLVVSLTLRGLINAQGLVRELALANFFTLIITLSVVITLAPWGLVAIAVGISLREVMLVLMLQRIVKRSALRMGFGETAYALLPALLATAAGLFSGLAVTAAFPGWLTENPALVFGSATMVILVCYAATLVLVVRVWRSHRPLRSVVTMFVESVQGVAPTLAVILRRIVKG